MKKLKISREKRLKMYSKGLFVLFTTFLIVSIGLGVKIVIEDGNRILFLLFLLSCCITAGFLVGLWLVNLFIDDEL